MVGGGLKYDVGSVRSSVSGSDMIILIPVSEKKLPSREPWPFNNAAATALHPLTWRSERQLYKRCFFSGGVFFHRRRYVYAG